MNKKLTLVLLTNLVIIGPMVTDASAAEEQTTTSSSSSSSSSSIGLSLAEKMEQFSL